MIATQTVLPWGADADAVLDGSHYLGASGARGRATYRDAHGLIVFASPSSRRLPREWIELSRWCLADRAGSQQWAACIPWVRETFADVTTVVSYSDPSVGHTGALYRACNWIWAPTWHELRPPPTGAGVRGGKRQEVKARWVFLMAPDALRGEVLALKDKSLARRYPWAGYAEPAWKKGRPMLTSAIMQRPKMWRDLTMAHTVKLDGKAGRT